MHYRKSVGDRLFDAFIYILLIFMIVITLYPMWYILVASFSSPAGIAESGVIMFFPKHFHVDFYKLVFQNETIFKGYLVTIGRAGIGTILTLILTSMGAYALSRKWLMGRGVLMFIIVIPMFFGGGLIPSYLLIRDIGLYNTFWVLVIPGLISSWNIIMMRTYFQSLGDALEESAKLDGANDMIVLFKIIVPCAKPIMAVIALWTVVGHWNAWFDASIYLKDSDLFPLQLILRKILINNSTNEMGDFKSMAGATVDITKGLKYATIIITTAPILAIYPFLQKYFVKGVMIGSLKG
jgi:putative aldouronate transport system permease protein